MNTKISTSFLMKLFNLPPSDNDKDLYATQVTEQILNITKTITSFLSHLLKENQFMYKLSDREVTTVLIDIESIKLKANTDQPIPNKLTNEDDGKLVNQNDISDELITKYIESVKNLTHLTNTKCEVINHTPRGINDYNFIELVAEFDSRVTELKSTTMLHKDLLKLAVGHHFGYTLKLNINDIFPDTTTRLLAQKHTVFKLREFFYPISYSMILGGNLLPNEKILKEHLLKLPDVNKIYSINILNDPNHELDKIFSHVNRLKREIVDPVEQIEDAERIMIQFAANYIKNDRTNTDKSPSLINEKIDGLTTLLDTSNMSVDIPRESHTMNRPGICNKNHSAIHSNIKQRLICVRELLSIIKEISVRNPVTIHSFNLEVLKRVIQPLVT